jgi:hypothetical protein
VRVGKQFTVGFTYAHAGTRWYLTGVTPSGVVYELNNRAFPDTLLTPTPTPLPTRAIVLPDGAIVYEIPPAPYPVVGGGGIDCWTFAAVAGGRAILTWHYEYAGAPGRPIEVRQFTVLVGASEAPAQIPAGP